MSLYDKASLIFSGSAGAGNEEVAYNIKPVEKLKVDELITNNKLLTSDGWSFSDSNITVANGKIVFNNAAQYATARWDTDVFEEGKTYRVSFRVEDFKGGASNSKLLAQQANNTQINTQIDRDGNYSFYYTPGAPDGTTHQNKFQLKTVTTSVEAKVSDFSIKEVEQKANDFSFVRASDLTATYEDPDGLIKKTRENLFTYSNDFRRNQVSPAPWGHSGLQAYYGPQNNPESVPSAGKAGYDQSNGASFLLSSTADSRHEVTLSQTVNGVQTISVYAKAGGYNFLFIRTQSANNEAFFNLSTGSVGTTASQVVEAKMESVGADWYRCSMTLSGNFTGVSFGLAAQDNVKSFAGDGSSGIYIMDAQREMGLVATPYIDRTGAAYSTAGIREDEPRYDYSIDNDAPPALLYEPERQNLLTHSEYFEGWSSADNATLTSNNVTSPEGVQNATKLLATGSGTVNHQVNSPSFTISGGAVTASIFAKKGNTNVVRLRLNGSSSQVRAWFDLQNGTTSVDANGTSTITAMGDGWYRCTVTEPGNTNTSVSLQVFINKILDQTSWPANGDEYIYIYGAQYEEGSCATSYIPTYGIAATRKGDTIPQYTPSKTNLDKYTFFAHSHSDRVTSDNRAPRLKGDGNSALMGIFVNGAGKKQFFLYENDATSALSKATFGSFEAGDETKYAFVVDNIALEAKLFVDGALRETISLSGRVDAKQVSIGNSDGNPDRIKSIMYFPEALEDGDVVSLTT